MRGAGANWGSRTAKSKSATRKEKERFFGRKLHLISCAKTGMPLTFIITSANVNDTTMLEQLVDKALATYPWMKPERLVADMGCDSVHNRQSLLNKAILPIIHIRKPPNGTLHMDTYTTIDELVCMGRKPMEYLRTDKEAGKHLYRYPASTCDRKGKIKGWSTCMDKVWADPKENLRVLSAVAQASDKWKTLYRMRPIIESSFRSLKHSWLPDRRYCLEPGKVERQIGLSILTYGLTTLMRTLGRSCGICVLERRGRGNSDGFKP